MSDLKKAMHYMFFVYSEFSLVALVNLYFINNVTSEVLANSSITFIIILYSTFLSFGFHNGSIRDGSVANNESKKKQIIALELQFSAVVFSTLCVIAYIFNDNFYLMMGLLIGASNHIRTACKTTFRLLNSIHIVNYLNITWSFFFLISFLVGVVSKYKENELHILFFSTWFFSSFIVMLLFYIYSIWLLKGSFFSKNILDGMREILVSSKYMFIISCSLVALLTSDRLILNYLKVNEEIIANFQYIDTLSNIYFFGGTAILYYFTTGMLNKFSELDKESHLEFIRITKKYITWYALVFSIFLIISSIFLKVIGNFTTPIFMILISMLLSKSAVVVFGFVCNYYLAKNQEKLIAFYYLILVIFIIVISYMFVSSLHNSSYINVLPLLSALMISSYTFFLIYKIKIS